MSTVSNEEENEMEVVDEVEDIADGEGEEEEEDEEIEAEDSDKGATSAAEGEDYDNNNDEEIQPNAAISPEEYQVLVEKELASLKFLLKQTKKDIDVIKQENVVLTELLIRRKFRNIAEVRPSFGRDRKKRSSNESAPAEKPKKVKKEKESSKAATQTVGGSPQPTQPNPSLTTPSPTNEEKPLSIKLTLKKSTSKDVTASASQPDGNTPVAPPVKQRKPRVSKSASKVSLAESIQSEAPNNPSTDTVESTTKDAEVA